MTVSELKDKLNTMCRRGYGDHKIVLSKDQEGNGFHSLDGDNDICVAEDMIVLFPSHDYIEPEFLDDDE
jgi:hypothetical protein